MDGKQCTNFLACKFYLLDTFDFVLRGYLKDQAFCKVSQYIPDLKTNFCQTMASITYRTFHKAFKTLQNPSKPFKTLQNRIWFVILKMWSFRNFNNLVKCYDSKLFTACKMISLVLFFTETWVLKIGTFQHCSIYSYNKQPIPKRSYKITP